MKQLLILLVLTCSALVNAQIVAPFDSIKPVTTIGGGLDFDYAKPQKYTLGPIRVEGADNFDHQAIKLIAGLRQGEEITLPSDKISKAIKNLWDEGLFSSVSIEAEKEIAGVVYLVIKLQPRPKHEVQRREPPRSG
jgi:outer membrane protein insertion porin family